MGKQDRHSTFLWFPPHLSEDVCLGLSVHLREPRELAGPSLFPVSCWPSFIGLNLGCSGHTGTRRAPFVSVFPRLCRVEKEARPHHPLPLPVSVTPAFRSLPISCVFPPQGLCMYHSCCIKYFCFSFEPNSTSSFRYQSIPTSSGKPAPLGI